MKKYIKSDSYLDQSDYDGELPIFIHNTISDISFKLQEVQSLCGKLEDFYWGEDVVSEFTKAYQFTTKALAALDRANAKL